MRLFYTGAPKADSAQTVPALSLGGFISSSQVPNGSENALFSNLSQGDLAKGGFRVILLALKNLVADIPQTSSGIDISYELESDDLYTVEIGLVSPALDSCGDVKFESIPNNKSLPVGITFQDAGTVTGSGIPATPVNIPALTLNGVIGIWVKLTIKDGVSDTLNSCDALNEVFLDPSSPLGNKDFPLKLNISYP